MSLPPALAANPAKSRGRLHPEHRFRPARPARHLPARPRPNHPFGRLPAPAPQDAGVRRPRWRSLSGSADAQPRSRADRPHDRSCARPQRRSDRGLVPGPRSRPPAVRPWRRRCAERSAERCRRLRPQCAYHSHRNPPGKPLSRLRRAQPQLGSARGACQAQRPGARSTWAMAEADGECDLGLGTWPGLEAQVAAIADDIAYDNHDIDDGLRAGLLDLDELIAAPDRRLRCGTRSAKGMPAFQAKSGSARWCAT